VELPGIEPVSVGVFPQISGGFAKSKVLESARNDL
jgi:hypothetical protein